jgi:hypothetical protein
VTVGCSSAVNTEARHYPISTFFTRIRYVNYIQEYLTLKGYNFASRRNAYRHINKCCGQNVSLETSRLTIRTVNTEFQRINQAVSLVVMWVAAGSNTCWGTEYTAREISWIFSLPQSNAWIVPRTRFRRFPRNNCLLPS